MPELEPDDAQMYLDVYKNADPEEDFGHLEDQRETNVEMLRGLVAMALDCARLSRDLLGANGIIDDYPIMRHLCNLETVKTYEGTEHIHTLVIGERVTGVAAYR